MHEIVIKSVASNRVRLKSELFYSKSNITKVIDEFDDIFLNFRQNSSCTIKQMQ
ncbi:MAG: hypothetical protein U9N02_03185 [Campylobacterota bacterium]|nr:hypothetical protein [Campylobacterota bacterium]